jgi:hypothetical protein
MTPASIAAPVLDSSHRILGGITYVTVEESSIRLAW